MRQGLVAALLVLWGGTAWAQVQAGPDNSPSLQEGVMTLPFAGLGATHILPFEANRRPGKELLFLDLRRTPVMAFIGVYEPTQSKPWPATYTGPICLEPFVELQVASPDVWQSFVIEDLTGDGLSDVLVYSTNEDGAVQAGRLTVGRGLQHCR